MSPGVGWDGSLLAAGSFPARGGGVSACNFFGPPQGISQESPGLPVGMPVRVIWEQRVALPSPDPEGCSVLGRFPS